ncbi:hypothetical protein HYU12_00990 [Candidatus Woesearchaeota archaeon]|nr:hypothetical protein [Candidatus Woesearchaeota archaeon]
MDTIDSLVNGAQPFLARQIIQVADMLKHLSGLENGVDYMPPASWTISYLAESLGLVGMTREANYITKKGRSVYQALVEEGFYAEGGKGRFPALRSAVPYAP